MLTDSADRLRKRLRGIGLSDSSINAAWPTWWSESADASDSARAELRYSIARKLGLNPHSLLEDNEAPEFIWKDEARFKHLSGQSSMEKWAITSFGKALSAMLVAATSSSESFVNYKAYELRSIILHNQPYVRLVDLLALCWSGGIPTIHLRVFPWRHKRMAAMSVRIAEQNTILLGKDSMYPAQIAFYLAHELAHVCLNHISAEAAIVDLESEPTSDSPYLPDPEENAADQFALELLTGHSKPIVLPRGTGRGARSLARAALRASADVQIEPGTLALCFGYSTRDWGSAIASLRYIYDSPTPVWQEVNKIALSQLSFEKLPEDTASYLINVLGNLA